MYTFVMKQLLPATGQFQSLSLSFYSTIDRYRKTKSTPQILSICGITLLVDPHGLQCPVNVGEGACDVCDHDVPDTFLSQST